VGVLDSSILVNAAIAQHPRSATVKVVEAAIGGLYVCVLSQSIHDETLDVLMGPPFRFLNDFIEELFAPLWEVAEWVPLGVESDRYASVVGDPDDVHVLRAAMGIYEHRHELVTPTMFVVSDNTSDFKPEVNFYGFQFSTAHRFWLRLQEANTEPSGEAR